MQQGQTFLVLRRLLARIRDIMAGEGDPQDRLNRLVAVIAADTAAEVCSVYIRRAGDVLELFATHGLRSTAVHSTRLRFGEGLVGEIAASARPLALAEAQNHPSFAFRPETGEEIYHSFMGVPVLHGGRVVGVLAIQNVQPRRYADEEIEALQTVAMVLAELVGRGDLIAREEMVPTVGIALVPVRLEGVSFNDGIGFGTAVLHQPRYMIRRLVAEDTRVEHDRLRQAVGEMHGALDEMLRADDLSGGGEHREVLEAYRMIAEDVGWLRRIGEAITSGLTAEAAVHKVNNDIHARLGSVSDPYLRERVHDLEDLASRLLQHLVGAEDAAPELPEDEDWVLVARNLGPAQLLEYDRSRLRGLVLEQGSPNAHVAIVARALDIPVVGQAQEALSRVAPGDVVIVDADHGQVIVRPDDDVRQAFAESLRARNERQAAYATIKDQPAVTGDGERVLVNMNAGLLVDMTHLDECGADGVGLYRTEVPFLVRSEVPDVEAQTRLYGKVLDYAADKPVTFRTLDVGGDKLLRSWASGEDNPAMGWRAIRVSFDRPAILRQQLRALIRAAADKDLRVMFPMIANVEEFDHGRRLLDRELERERRRGSVMPSSVRVGAMIEVPSLLFQLDALLQRVDFVSVGTNDLVQFLFASDRVSARLHERYDELSPVVLRVLRDIAQKSDAAGVEASVCGEMAAQPLGAMALLGIGFRNISVAPSGVPAVKLMVGSVMLSPLTEYMERLYDENQMSVRQKVRAFALDHGVTI